MTPNECAAPVSVDVRVEMPEVESVEADASVDLVIRVEMPQFIEAEVG